MDSRGESGDDMRSIIAISAVLLAVTAALTGCLPEPDNPMDPPDSVSSGALLVDTGYTKGSDGLWIYDNLGEYSAFTLHWEEVDNAAFYEVRASYQPITEENWDDAILMEVVTAPADSVDAFNVVEIQEEVCIKCGLCEVICPMDAITIQGSGAVIDYERCTACGLCMDECPVDAITGTRNGQDYYFGVRAYFDQGVPDGTVLATDDAYRIIFFNTYLNYWGPTTKNCGRCQPGEDSLGCFAGCHILEDWLDQERTIFTGYGCQYDAIWQDTMGLGPIPFMVYIDYDKCVSCGVCFMECWNYNRVINPNPDPGENYEGLKSVMHRVVPSNWTSTQPPNPY